MPILRVNWQQLKDQQLETVTGALFTVVRVTDRYVTIQPERGRRTYALSIAAELEPGVAVYASRPRLLPPPAQLVHLGVRPILLSYAWGILKAVVVDGMGARTVSEDSPQNFEGFWTITNLPDQEKHYITDSEETPELQIWVQTHEGILGHYQIGFSAGSLSGAIREFGGEPILVFGFAGDEESETENGGGWMQLLDLNTLEGEFIGMRGRFTAKREKAKQRPGKTRKR
jgi:hypothetical protein